MDMIITLKCLWVGGNAEINSILVSTKTDCVSCAPLASWVYYVNNSYTMLPIYQKQILKSSNLQGQFN